METTKNGAKVLKVLLKDFAIIPTITSLAKEVGMSRVGAWKVVKKLEKEKSVLISAIGAGKTSTQTIQLNWNNPVTEKKLALMLTEDALTQQRWLSNFGELENEVDFLILYGSIIHSPKEANDIDVIGVTSKKNFNEIEEIINRLQKMQLKKIHALNFTRKELMQEIKKLNKAFIAAIKKGIVLFGQEKFIKFMREVRK